MLKIQSVDLYLEDGCGRCSLAATPQCKVHKWTNELKLLREIVLESGLEEQVKWGMPCYTLKNKNILMIAAFKDYCSINFFKGSLLQDSEQLLVNAGENSQQAKLFKVQNINQITDNRTHLRNYIFEAIEIEKAGLKTTAKKVSDFEFPIEFLEKLNADSNLKKAFESLTPGRQKSFLIHFNQAKQSKTKISRIEKAIPSILKGKGFNEY